MNAIEYRFWEKTKKSDSNDCILWIGAKDGEGYGRFRLGKKLVSAHRFIYFHINPLASTSDNILHTCDNPSCVNINHLYAGGQKENLQEALKKERLNTKLSKEQIEIIRDRGNYRTAKSLAAEFQVDVSTINQIRRKQTWRQNASLL